jgi:hypothetical protein
VTAKDEKTSKPNIIKVINQVGGGDEVWFNPGDGRFYVTGVDKTIPTGVQSLGVINAETSEWLQNVPDVLGKNAAALPENNHIFTIVQITAAIGRALRLTPAFASRNLTSRVQVASQSSDIPSRKAAQQRLMDR